MLLQSNMYNVRILLYVHNTIQKNKIYSNKIIRCKRKLDWFKYQVAEIIQINCYLNHR